VELNQHEVAAGILTGPDPGQVIPDPDPVVDEVPADAEAVGGLELGLHEVVASTLTGPDPDQVIADPDPVVDEVPADAEAVGGVELGLQEVAAGVPHIRQLQQVCRRE